MFNVTISAPRKDGVVRSLTSDLASGWWKTFENAQQFENALSHMKSSDSLREVEVRKCPYIFLHLIKLNLHETQTEIAQQRSEVRVSHCFLFCTGALNAIKYLRTRWVKFIKRHGHLCCLFEMSIYTGEIKIEWVVFKSLNHKSVSLNHLITCMISSTVVGLILWCWWVQNPKAQSKAPVFNPKPHFWKTQPQILVRKPKPQCKPCIKLVHSTQKDNMMWLWFFKYTQKNKTPICLKSWNTNPLPQFETSVLPSSLKS